jgi:3-methyladenine DNA glycosylase Tag
MSDTPNTPAATPAATDAPVSPNLAVDAWDTPAEPKEPKAEPKAETKPEPKPKRWLTAKVDGKEEKVDEDTLIREYQKAKAADKKFQEAAKIRQEYEDFKRKLKESPEELLNDPDLAIDRQKLAESWIMKQIEAEMPKDPKEIKLKEYEEKLKKYQEIEKQAQEEQQRQEFDQVVSKRREEIGNLLSDAMKKSPLSKNPETAAATLREMALYYRSYKAETGEAPNAEELANHVEQKYYKGMYELSGTLEGEDLVQFLGEGVVNKIRKYDLAKLKGGNKEAPAPQVNPSKDAPTLPKVSKGKTESPFEARERIRKMLGKG